MRVSMFLKVLPLGLALGLLSVSTLSFAAPDDEASKKTIAIKVATDWVKLVDSGKYGKSWEQAAALFKGAVTKDKWREAIVGVRKPLGLVKSRNLKSAQYRTELPGAPDGHYVIVQFNTEFKNKKSATETITPMLDPDGKWRVSGYYIK